MKELRLPSRADTLSSLEAGDEVLISGDVLTMRDATLVRAQAMVDEGRELPFDLKGQLVFHAGPSPAAVGRPIGSIGPTTSKRMDQFLPMLFDLGVVATLGKGPRSERAVDLHRRYVAVYLAAVGGVAAVMGGMVTASVTIAWEDLGPEAVYRVMLKEFPAVVAIDSTGRDYLSEQYDLYRRGE